MENFIIILYIILTFVATFEFFSVYRQTPSPSQKILLLLVTTNLLFIFGYTYSLVSFDTGSYFMSSIVEHIGAVYIGFGFVHYICANCGYTIKKWQYVLMLSFNLIVISFFCTDFRLHLMYSSIELIPNGNIVEPSIVHGPLFISYVILMLAYFLIILGLAVYSRKKKEYIYDNVILRKNLFCVLNVSVGIAVSFVFDLFRFIPVDISTIITVMGVAFVLRTNRTYPAYSLKTNTQEDILNELSDMILVTDKNDGFLFANKACKEYLNDELVNVSNMMPITDLGPKTSLLLTADSGEVITINNLKFAFSIIKSNYNEEIEGTIRWFKDVTREHQYITELEYLRNNLAEEVAIQTKEVRRRQKEVEELSMQMVVTLADAIDAKDAYTKGHSTRVSCYSVLLGRKLGLSDKELENLRYAAILHDIGKIGVPDVILNKPERLTETEYSLIKTHTSIGGEILKSSNTIKDAALIARHHHEKYDGTGYPDGLVGEAIPYVSRIVAIADAYDAMNSSRVYRKKLDPLRIRDELVRGKGKQFDPHMTDVFIQMIDADELITEPGRNEENDDNNNVSMAKESGELLRKVMEQIALGAAEEEYDLVTGLLTRNVGERKIFEAMRKKTGGFVFFDVDNLKKINDTYGHEAGDAALSMVGHILKEIPGNIACRLGGDEFLAFFEEMDESDIVRTVSEIIERYMKLKNENPVTRAASISAGIVMTDTDSIYEEVYNHADKALYHVKQNGKAGYFIYGEKERESEDDSVNINLLQKSIVASGSYEGAMDVEYRQFTKLYEYTKNICERYDFELRLIMITMASKQKSPVSFEETETAMKYMEQSINECIRNVDIFSRYGKNKFILICLNANEEQINLLIKRVISRFYKICGSSIFEPVYEVASNPETGHKS